MTDGSENVPLVNDPAREATASMRGYWAQVWRSVLVWMEMGDTERLYLEGAEDFDRIGGLSAETTQVKDKGGNITLRSQDVIEAIDNAWAHQQRNPRRSIRFRFLTTAGIGAEQGGPFRDKLPGLHLWESCRSSSDAAQADQDARAIADFLLSEGKVSPAVQAFLRTTPATQIREKLISAIEWDTDAAEAPEVIREIKDRLVMLGSPAGAPPESAEAVADHLYAIAYEIATRQTDRYLTRADLLRRFHERTRVSLPAAAANALLAAIPRHMVPAGSVSLAVGGKRSAIGRPPPLPPRYYPRNALLSDIGGRLSAHRVLVLQGSTGTGKSVAAAALAASSALSWGWADLRGARTAELSGALDQIASELDAESGLTHLVIDDIELTADVRSLETPLARIGEIVIRRAGQLVITSAVGLPQRLALTLSLASTGTVSIPPFTREEIAGFLTARGCSPAELAGSWATFVQLQTSGHAQLVHARVATLEDQGFPQPNLEQITATPADVVEARTEARRLVEALDAPTRELIYRLSLTTHPFPQRQVLAIGQYPPPIAEPGMAFDHLIGPWVERVTEGLYRISPLLRDIGKEIQGESWAKQMHTGIARALLSSRMLSPMDVSAVLLHATVGEDWGSVARLSFGLLTADEETWQALAEGAEWFALVGVGDAALRPRADVFSLFLIRTLQLRLAAAAKNTFAATSIIARSNEEVSAGAAGPHERLIRHNFLTQVLRHDVKLPIQQLVGVGIEYIRLSDELRDMLAGFEKIDRVLNGPDGRPDLAGLAGFSLLPNLTDRASLIALLDESASFEVPLIRRMLWFIGGSESTTHFVFQRIWLTELKSSTPDWTACREAFRRAYDFGQQFGLPGFAQAAAREIARITDENLNEPEDALRLADKMIGEVGSSPGLEDGRATILLRKRDNRAALEILRKLLPTWKPRDEFDLQQTFSNRHAAIAAGRLGEWKEAARWLRAARDLAAEDPATYRAGLLIDEGFAWWKAGDSDRALGLLAEGLVAIEALPADELDEAAYTLRKRAGHTVMWMARVAAGSPPKDFSEPTPAFCSNPDPFQQARLPSTPQDAMWTHLLEFEFYADLGTRYFVVQEGRLADSPYGLVRFSFDGLRLQHRLRDLEFDDLVEVVAHYAESVELCRLYYKPGGLGGAEPLPENVAAIAPEQLSTEFLLVGLLNAIFALGARGIITQQHVDRWRSEAAKAGVSAKLDPWLDFVDALFLTQSLDAETAIRNSSRDWTFQAAASVKLATDDKVTPELLLMTHGYWANILPKAEAGVFVLSDLEHLVTDGWQRMSARPMLLRAPAMTVPALLKVCASHSTGWRKIGEVLTVACDAVSARVPGELRRRFQELAGT